MQTSLIGTKITRKDAWDKVTGDAKYTADYQEPGIFYAKIVTSNQAHAKILSINTDEAYSVEGVKAVVTGDQYPKLYGSEIEDHPPLALGKVRYFGEPIALVVAVSEKIAAKAAFLIKVDYEPLLPVGSPKEALLPGAALVHEYLAGYTIPESGIYPEAGTNICTRVKIRKGDPEQGFANSDVIIEEEFVLPRSDHAAMETRAVIAKVHQDGTIRIRSSTQAPFGVQKSIAAYFGLEPGKVAVKAPYVGGGFGGKAPVQLEFLAVMASKAIGGKTVKLINSREEDLVSSPSRIGAEATIKIGACQNGLIKAAQMTFFIDTGAYSDTGTRITKAIAMDSSGPYNIENLNCDSMCIYTNHTYATSFRGFGHETAAFCLERSLDKLAFKLGLDPLELRLKNVLEVGQTSPSLIRITRSNAGDFKKCLLRLKEITNWDEGMKIVLPNGLIKAKGLGCFWKTSNSPTDAISSVLLTFNEDGSININSGAVEIGPSMKTTLALILAERLKMDINRINVKFTVNTITTPSHWKTVASMTTFMAGRAILNAAEDLISQLKKTASAAMRCPKEDLEVAGERVFLRQDPTFYLPFTDLVFGFKYPEGHSIGGQIMGRGSFIMSHLTDIKKDTGQGKHGPAWAVGAQAIEIEYNPRDFTYRILKAFTVIDAGKVLNPSAAAGVVKGGMCMGLGLASREVFIYDADQKTETTSLRSYKMMHIGEEPEYIVEFIETPQIDAPYGARGIAEHGIIGIPAALANALSAATDLDLNRLPLTPEYIWKMAGGNES